MFFFFPLAFGMQAAAFTCGFSAFYNPVYSICYEYDTQDKNNICGYVLHVLFNVGEVFGQSAFAGFLVERGKVVSGLLHNLYYAVETYAMFAV